MGVFQQKPWVFTTLPTCSWSLHDVAASGIKSASLVVHIWVSSPVTNFLYSGFEWSSLPAGSVVVDIGAGDGSEMFEIAQIAPHVKLIVEDREQTIKEVTTPVRAAFIAYIASILELTIYISSDLA